MKYLINSKNAFSCKMLFALTQIFLVLLAKALSANYIPVSGSQHPYVVPSPSVSLGRSTSVMQEKECFVARMCEYKVLENFSCKVSEYVISNGVDRTLPKWLWFDERNQTLKGIPSPADEGLSEILITGLNRHQTEPIDYICGLLTVKINVWNVKYFPLFTQNVPTSPVVDNKLFKPGWQAFTCKFNEPIVLASLVLAGNFHEMDGKEKINLLDELLQSYHVSIYDVFMLPNNGDSLSGLLQTSHVLASGPGANRSASGLSTIVTWHVRCGVIHLDDALFTALEKLSRQLTIINNVGYAPIGWHVVTGFQRQHVRRRRNVIGTTTLAYSTVPISRVTVITTKIKITKTTYGSATRNFTWTRPLPTFSSPYTANKTSLYNQSSTISWFNGTITPTQYNSVSSTSLVKSSPNTVSSQIISPSKYERSEISQYKSVSSTLLSVLPSSGSISSPSRISTLEMKNLSSTKVLSVSPLTPSGQRWKTSMSGSGFSTLPMISQSRNKSAILQVSSSNSSTSSQINATSRVTGTDSSSFTSQPPYSKRGTLVRSSLTVSTFQKSTYVIAPSSKNITPSVPSAVHTVLNSTSISSTIFFSLKTISSLVIRSIFSSQQYLTPTSKYSITWNTTTMTKAIQQSNSTTSLLQSSYSDLTDSVSQSTSTTYSAVLHITTSRIISENKSTNLYNQTLYESSNAYTRSMLSIATTPSTNNVVTAQKSSTTDPSYVPYTSLSESSLRRSHTTPSLFLSCTSSCLVSTLSKNLNFTLASGDQQDITTSYQASVITRKTSLSSSRITETLVLNTRSVTQQTSEYVNKTPESPVLTSRIISKSLQSSDYITFKTLTTTSTIYPSSLSSGFGKTIPSSLTGAMTSQRTSGSRVKSTFTSTLMKTRFTVSKQTEQLRSTLSSPIKPTSTYTLAVTKTIRSGSLITNIVRDHSVSSLLTSHISRTFSSYVTRSDVGDYSMTVSSKPSISFHPSTGSSMSHTLTKSSSKTSWLVRPSYTWQGPPTTTVVLTLTSMKIPVITSHSGVYPSFTSFRSSSTVVRGPTPPSRESPKIYNNFDLLRVTVGKVFSVQIPADTFHDREDGNTRNLKLECLTVAHTRLSSNSWLQFNSTTQTLNGLVLKSQLKTIPSEYLLSASDQDGNTAYDAFTVSIEESSKVLAAMFSVELTGINLEMFNSDINIVLSMVQTIAGYYGDSDESMIQVLYLMEGSVIFTWSNTSLQTCDKYLIDDVASKIITSEGNIQQDFYNALSPRYTANNVFVNYTGPCVVPSTGNPSVTEVSSYETSPWLKYFLPLLAVAVVIAVIVVVFLLVKRRSGVKILKEDKQTFKRRKPIILDDERELSTLCRKPVELPEDSLSPIRFSRESSLGTPEYDEDDFSELPSPILPAPSYRRLPPKYSGQYNRYNTPPPAYKLPPSY